jgi:hypothetical protein
LSALSTATLALQRGRWPVGATKNPLHSLQPSSFSTAEDAVAETCCGGKLAVEGCLCEACWQPSVVITLHQLSSQQRPPLGTAAENREQSSAEKKTN